MMYAFECNFKEIIIIFEFGACSAVDCRCMFVMIIITMECPTHHATSYNANMAFIDGEKTCFPFAFHAITFPLQVFTVNMLCPI